MRLGDIGTSAALAEIRREFAVDGYKVDFRPFAYTLSFESLAAAGQQEETFTVEASAHFAVCSTHMSMVDAASVPTLPRGLCQITEIATGRPINDRETDINNLFGSAHRPFVWPWPLVIDAKQAMSLLLTNNAATTQTFRAAFFGVKIFTSPLQP